jgi:hypothetical protein
MEINGLPLHPLAVHAAVVLSPLAALLAIAYAVPAWRDKLRWPLLVAALLAVGAVVLAYLSGDSFRGANPFFNDPASPVTEKIDTHEDYGFILLWVTVGFGVVALANVLFHHSGARWLRVLLVVLLVLDAITVLVLTFLTGEAGAEAVWGDGFSG